jgi:hypothetical protein
MPVTKSLPLDDQIEPLLQFIGDAEVPHRCGNQHTVGECEPHGHALEFGESVPLGAAELAPVLARVFRFQCVAVELGQGFAPDVHHVDVPVWPHLLESGHEHFGAR